MVGFGGVSRARATPGVVASSALLYRRDSPLFNPCAEHRIVCLDAEGRDHAAVARTMNAFEVSRAAFIHTNNVRQVPANALGK